MECSTLWIWRTHWRSSSSSCWVIADDASSSKPTCCMSSLPTPTTITTPPPFFLLWRLIKLQTLFNLRFTANDLHVDKVLGAGGDENEVVDDANGHGTWDACKVPIYHYHSLIFPWTGTHLAATNEFLGFFSPWGF